MFADVTLDRERDIVARPGPLDPAALDLHRPDCLREVGRVTFDMDSVTYRQRCRQPNRGYRQMRVPMNDCPDRIAGLVFLGHLWPSFAAVGSRRPRGIIGVPSASIVVPVPRAQLGEVVQRRPYTSVRSAPIA